MSRLRPGATIALLLTLTGSCGGNAFSTDDGGVAGAGGSGARESGADAPTDANPHDAMPDGAGGSSGLGGSDGGRPDAGGTGGSGGTAGTGGMGGTSGAGGAGGSPVNSGDCADDSDCPNSTCIAVTPGGYRVCRVHYPEAAMCEGSGQCCSTADCQKGICYPAPLAPACGGPAMAPSNVCASDICTSDASCAANEICVPAGTLDRKVRMCVPALCRTDTDCTALPGGFCAPISGGCCDGILGLYCVYPGSGCRSNADCTGGSCGPNAKGAAECGTPTVCAN